MAKITITIDGDNITINQSVATTKVEQKNRSSSLLCVKKNMMELLG